MRAAVVERLPVSDILICRVFAGHQQRAAVLFAAADLVLTVIAFEAAYRTRGMLPLREFSIEAPLRWSILMALLLAVVGVGRAMGIHARLYTGNVRQAAVDTLRQVSLSLLALMAFLYLLNLETPISRPFTALLAAYLAVGLIVYRAAAGGFRGELRKALGAEASYLVVGDGEKALEMARELEAAEPYGVRLAGIVDCGGGLGPRQQFVKQYPVYPLDALPRLLREQVVDEVVFAVSGKQVAELEGVFVLCDEHGVKTRLVADFFPHVHSRMYFDRFGTKPLLTFSTSPGDELLLLTKRVFDIALAAACLTLLAAPMAVLACAIRLTSRGPAIFRQTRCGLNGRAFQVYKFRSMVENAEALRTEVEHLNEKDGPVFKIADDPRLTGLGRFLRRYSIDEWPQFWNVLRGDMSLVGPRPAVPAEVERYEIWQRRRLRMRPGLTCLWAVRGRDKLDFETWMKLDLEYIDHWSPALDLKILAQSIPRVLGGKGAS